ncbi:MAG: tetratricopeptide repeat protein, partial [Chitinivibrionales bacterium]|nr:tetratricopeptide repeat protein [Chitinivibrionales bacterium]
MMIARRSRPTGTAQRRRPACCSRYGREYAGGVWRLGSGLLLAVCALAFAALAQSYDFQLYDRADNLRREGRTDAAIAAYREVLSYYPDHHHAWDALGRLYLARGRAGSARCAFERALRHNPRWPRAYRGLAQAYEELGHVDSALTQLQRCLPFVSGAERNGVREDISRLERRRQRGAEAESDEPPVDSVTPVPSRTPAIEALFQEAVEHYKNRRFHESLNTIHDVLSRQPDHGGAFYYGGLIRRRRGEDRLARINFTKGLAYPELGYNAHFYLGKIHGDAQEYDLAIRHLRAYVRRSTYQAGLEEAEALIRRYRTAIGDSVVGPIDTLTTEDRAASNHGGACAVPEGGLARYLAPSLHDTTTVELPAATQALDLLRQGEFAQAAGLLEEWLLGVSDTATVPLALFNL